METSIPHLKEVNNMFWALVLENGKRYSQTVEQSFHISMAALEIPTDPDSTKGKHSQGVSVMIANQKSEFLICSLNTRNITQQPLDLNFNEGEEVTFFVNGPGTVHLTGYQIDDEDMDMLDEMDEEDEDDEGDERLCVPQLVPAKKRKTDDDEPGSLKKKTKWLTPGGGDFDDDSDDDSSEDDDFDPMGLIDLEADEDDDDDSDEDDDLEDEDDLSDDDDEEIEEEQVKKIPQSDKKIQKKQQTPNMNGKKVEQNKKSEQTPKQEKKKSKGQTETPKQEKKQENAASTPGPGGDGDQSAKKKKKKKKKNKTEQNEGSQDENVAKTPQAQQKQQNQTPKQKQQAQTPKQNQTPKQKQQAQTPKQNQTPKQKQQAQTPGKTPQGKTPQGKAEQQSKTPKRMVLPGGILAEDITSGDGPLVKNGKMAHVYYVGKLQKDGRQFDSCTSGKPFRFKFGLGEVIQGWDKGLEGMKVGGKRRLTVPPQQGYGNQRSGPIPPNSTLVFEVELKNVS